MVLSGSSEKRELESGQKQEPQAGQLPVVVFISVTVSLWAIVVMLIGQTIGRVMSLAFPLVSIVAGAVTVGLIRHGMRRTLRVVVTIGDAVSVATTALLGFAARGLLDWPFLAPLTVADDAARHFGMVNWIATHQSLPNSPTPELLQFAEYPMSAHYLAATIARSFGIIPLRVANMLAVGVTYGMWMLLGSAAAFGLHRMHPRTPRWQKGLAAATVPLVGYAVYTLTLWAVTASYFYAQVIGLWFACVVTALVLTNPDLVLGASKLQRFRRLSRQEHLYPELNHVLGGPNLSTSSLSTSSLSASSLSGRAWSPAKDDLKDRLPLWWPVLATLTLGPSLVYPLHLLLTAGSLCVAVFIERRLISAAALAMVASVLGLAVQLRWLGAATKMSQEEGAILQPTFANLGGITVAILLTVGLLEILRTKIHTMGALTVVLGGAQVGALVLGHAFGAVSKYTSIKVVSSLIPGLLVTAAFGAVALARKFAELVSFGFSADPSGPSVATGSAGPSGPTGPSDPSVPTEPSGPAVPTGPTGPTGSAGPSVPTGPSDPDRPWRAEFAWRRSIAPLVASAVVVVAMIQAIRFPPLTGLTRPLVSADGYRVTRWASTHVDPNKVGIVAPGIEAYSLWWVALDRKKDLAVLRNMQPSSTLWSEWPAESAERYLIVVTEGQAKSFTRRPGVKVLFQSGSAVLLDRVK